MKFVRKHKLYEGNSGSGFFNPFSDDLNDISSISDVSAVKYEDDPLYNGNKKTLDIKNVSLWNKDTTNKVVYRDNKMFAGKYFDIDDIVEVAPVKLMSDKDMYSERIRDCAFTIDSSKGIYALPLGYAVCYRNSKESGFPGNISYSYDEDNNTIIIVAISKIRKGEELIFAATDEDFANEIQPGQFQYNQGHDPVYAVSNIKIV